MRANLRFPLIALANLFVSIRPGLARDDSYLFSQRLLQRLTLGFSPENAGPFFLGGLLSRCVGVRACQLSQRKATMRRKLSSPSNSARYKALPYMRVSAFFSNLLTNPAFCPVLYALPPSPRLMLPFLICKVDIVVATPGRLLDHIAQTPGFTLQHLRYLVIDEADRLLNQSYQGWVKKVIKAAYRCVFLPNILDNTEVFCFANAPVLLTKLVGSWRVSFVSAVPLPWLRWFCDREIGALCPCFMYPTLLQGCRSIVVTPSSMSRSFTYDMSAGDTSVIWQSCWYTLFGMRIRHTVWYQSCVSQCSSRELPEPSSHETPSI